MGFEGHRVRLYASNHNNGDMLAPYRLGKAMGLEFAKAAFHNSYYFNKNDNRITDKNTVWADLELFTK